MAIPTPEMLGLYYPSKDISTPGTSLPDRTVDSGSATMLIVSSSLTEDTDYWNGAVGFFCGESTSVLRGQTFHVKKWTKETNTLQVTSPLPAAPAAGDTFKIFIGGKAASSQEVLSMRISGKQPEADTVSGATVTGVVLKKASALLGEGTLTAAYTYSATNRTLRIRMGSDEYGPEYIITGNASGVALFDKRLAGFVIADITYAALPTTNRTDTFTVTAPKGNLIPNFEGYETNDGLGRTRYHLIVAKNKMGTVNDVMNALSIWTGKPAGTPSTMASSYSYALNYTTPMQVYLNTYSDWPARGFWIRNRTKNDLRYVDYRNGNILYTKIVDWGTLTFKNTTVELISGMKIGNSASSPSITAIIDQVVLESGTWESGTASGTLILKKYTGTSVFGTTAVFYVDGVSAGTCNGVSSRGYRGKTAQAWAYTDTVEPISDIDIGINLPSGGYFKNPPNENTAPDGVVFGLYPAQDECRIVDYLTGGASVGIWMRQTILDGTQAREDITGDLNFCWF